MKILIAMDSFKGSMTSMQAGNACAEGIKQIMPDAEVIVRPLADGGEGTSSTLTLGMGGQLVNIKCTGPLGDKVDAAYGIIKESKTAIIEMASAAGITLVPEDKMNPMRTTTYGVGEMIIDAIAKGCRNFIIGIGGSATNDGGAGMLKALGFSLLDKNGIEIENGAGGLAGLYSISDDNVPKELSKCYFKIACDVTNPLLGDNGCSAVFAPQKGADRKMIAKMDKYLEHFSKLTSEFTKKPNYCNAKGAGAAGGLGFAFLSYTNASLCSGVSLVFEETELEKYIKNADLIITGEGKLDGQTVMGKAPIGVARLAKKYDKYVIAFAGVLGENVSNCKKEGIDSYYEIKSENLSLEENMQLDNAKENMINKVKAVFCMTFGNDKQVNEST